MKKKKKGIKITLSISIKKNKRENYNDDKLVFMIENKRIFKQYLMNENEIHICTFF